MIIEMLGFSVGTFPIRYLGVPLHCRALRNDDFAGMIRKMTDAIRGWSGRHLSYAGRSELLRTVLYGIQNFWSRVFFIPHSVLECVESICRQFLWGSCGDRHKQCAVAWHDVCAPKEMGGLGFKEVLSWNKANMLCFLRDLDLRHEQSIWVHWALHYKLHNQTLWTVQAKPSDSVFWKHLLLLRDVCIQRAGGATQLQSVLHSADSARGRYDLFTTPRQPVPWAAMVWHSLNLPKVRYICWLACLQRLQTRDRVRRFMPLIDEVCPLCGIAPESHDHIFFSCTFSRSVLHKIMELMGVSFAGNSLQHWIVLFHRARHPKSQVFQLRAAGLCTVIYVVWEARNRRVFQDTTCSVEYCVFRVCQLLRSFWFGRVQQSRKTSSIGHNLGLF